MCFYHVFCFMVGCGSPNALNSNEGVLLLHFIYLFIIIIIDDDDDDVVVVVELCCIELHCIVFYLSSLLFMKGTDEAAIFNGKFWSYGLKLEARLDFSFDIFPLLSTSSLMQSWSIPSDMSFVL